MPSSCRCYHISLRGNMRQMRILEFRYNVEKLKEKKWISRKDSQASDLKPTFEPDKEGMEQVFRKISNGKEMIEFSDLRQLLHKMNVADADREAKQMMQAADFNNDGFLDFDEFMKVTKDVSMRELKDAFGMFDENRDGHISAEDIKRMMQKLGESCTLEDCARMVKHVDKNGDGLVDMDEFVAMMTGTRKPI
nr:PREDICTED: probable calcium-binding protein CML23 [Musa acuminata subsp. malaccensis]